MLDWLSLGLFFVFSTGRLDEGAQNRPFNNRVIPQEILQGSAVSLRQEPGKDEDLGEYVDYEEVKGDE